jgi:putative nucleotidyltransferase with HDIG domain
MGRSEWVTFEGTDGMDTSPANILIVDSDPKACDLMRHALSESGLPCSTATDCEQAAASLASQSFTVMIADISTLAAGGRSLLRQARQSEPECRAILTGDTSVGDPAATLPLCVLDCFDKSRGIHGLVEAVRRVTRTGAEELEMLHRQASLDSILALVHAVEAKDPYTRRHSEQVAHYAVHIAEHLELSEGEVESIRIAALVHDIGKIGVPDHILSKPGPLTEEEFEEIRRHPRLGAEILENIRAFSVEACLVRYHHENWDGSGYPGGLVGEETPLGARIVGIGDSIDAMLMERTYKQGYSVERMLGELTRCAGTQFQPWLVAGVADWCHRHPDEMFLPGPDASEKRRDLRGRVLRRQAAAAGAFGCGVAMERQDEERRLGGAA